MAMGSGAGSAISGGAMMGMGAAGMLVGGLMSKKGRKPGISPMEQESLQRKIEAEKTLSKMFQDRAKDPFQYVMGLEEQKYYDTRRDEIYGQQRERQQQGLMGAMNRTGTLGSGATQFRLGQFAQDTLRDKQQFYFQDQASRLQQKEQAVANTFSMGQGVLGGPALGAQQTDVMNARARQHNAWRNRWANVASSAGGQMMGAGMGKMASS